MILKGIRRTAYDSLLPRTDFVLHLSKVTMIFAWGAGGDFYLQKRTGCPPPVSKNFLTATPCPSRADGQPWLSTCGRRNVRAPSGSPRPARAGIRSSTAISPRGAVWVRGPSSQYEGESYGCQSGDCRTPQSLPWGAHSAQGPGPHPSVSTGLGRGSGLGAPFKTSPGDVDVRRSLRSPGQSEARESQVGPGGLTPALGQWVGPVLTNGRPSLRQGGWSWKARLHLR